MIAERVSLPDRSEIAAIVTDADMRSCRLWEISENLHRAELTALDRAKLVEEWRELTCESGIRKTASELGTTREDGRRSLKIASLSPEAQDAAREAGLDSCLVPWRALGQTFSHF